MHPPPAQNAASRTTPLWAVLLLTFVCSIGSAIIYGGVFFLARFEYKFSDRDNYALALLFGLTYMPGALGAGPLLRALKRSGVAPRTVLAALMVIMAGVCFLPLLANLIGGAKPGTGHASWALWAAIAVYSPASGMMWPIIESFLAGGRSEHQLRAATGRFNVTWSSSIVITMFGIAPFVEARPLQVIAALGALHLVCIGIIGRFAQTPAGHAPPDHTHCAGCGYDMAGNTSGRCPECGLAIPPAAHHARPLVYRQLLTFLRMLLPVSFMFNSTLSPYMPTALKALGIPILWQTPVTAIWYFTRVLTFLAMERWHGWHGKWSTPVFGTLLLLASFAWLVITPIAFAPGIGLWFFIAGLAAFGIGVGVIYAAALYYAMEVGASGVDAGGVHETLIGAGYSAGPLCGLAGIAAAGAGLVRTDTSSLLTLALVSTLAVAVGSLALHRAFRGIRRT